MSERALFDFLRRRKREWTGNPKAGLSPEDVRETHDALRAPEGPAPVTPGKALKEASGPVPTSKIGPLAAIVGSVAATSLFATVPQHEGLEYKAYRDIAGIWTICYGDTRNVRAGLIETPEGCRQRLERQLLAHAKPVMACTPRLSEQGRDWQRAAAVSLAYNIGVGAWCRSTADKLFDRGEWRAGCDQFLRWNRASGKVVKGLTRRRQEERAVCLRGIA